VFKCLLNVVFLARHERHATDLGRQREFQ
jgi:hypothetical protein